MVEKEKVSQDMKILDALITVTENWKLLVLGPLAAALLIIPISLLWPKTYESVGIVRLNEADQALITTNTLLNPLIDKMGLLAEFDGSREEAREYLIKKIATKYDRKTGLVTITVKEASPERAQELARATIDLLLLELLPKGKNKEKINQTIRINENIISNNLDAIEQLKKQMLKSTAGETNLEVVMKHYASLSTEVSRKELENLDLKNSLTINGDEFYVQQPSKAEKHNFPKLSLIIYSTILITELILMLCLFMQKLIYVDEQSEIFRKKISIIKKNLRIKR